MLCTRSIRLVLAHWNNSPRGDMSLHSDTLSCLTSFCYFSCVLERRGKNTNSIFFGVTGPELEPTIYHTRWEHANHYTTDGSAICPTKPRPSQTINIRSICSKPRECTVMYLCAKDIDVASFDIWFWSCSDSMIFCVFHFILSAVKTGLQSYCDTTYSRGGVNLILRNHNPVISSFLTPPDLWQE